MKCIVTGGAGFIGSHLVDRLLKDGHTVIVVDNLSTGRKSNLDHINSSGAFGLILSDLSEPYTDYPVFKDTDWIFHIAGLADIVPSIERPKDYFKANVTGTVNILEIARKYKVKRFIYTASSSCYGDNPSVPTDEEEPCNPQYPYALTKYLGEQCVLHWSKLYKIPAVSLRLFNVYGPRMFSSNYGSVFKVFMAQKANNQPCTIVGKGNQRRDFIFVSDVVDALVKAAQSNISEEVINIGSGQTKSVSYLYYLLGFESYIQLEYRPGEPRRTWADISKAKRLLGFEPWEPKVDFRTGVKIMLEHLDEYKNEPVWTKEKIEGVTKEWFKSLT